MTSQLNVDTIVDKAGSGGTNVKVGNTSTYVADGGSATQNLVQGIAKAWGDCTHEAVITDSLNLSGGVDNGVGDYTYSFTNNMAAANYSIPINVGYASLISFDNAEQASSSYNLRLFTRADSLTAADATNHSTLHGDLA